MGVTVNGYPITEVCKTRRISRNMVYYYIHNGTITPEVVGGRYFISDEDIAFLVAKRDNAERTR